jgi:hypothetical protein
MHTNKVIFQLSDLKNQYTEFIGDIGDVVIALFAPDGELLGYFFPLTPDLV